MPLPFVIASTCFFPPSSLRGSFCEPKQSRFCVSQYALGTGDCHVGAKGAPPRNDGWGRTALLRTVIASTCFFPPSSLRGSFCEPWQSPRAKSHTLLCHYCEASSSSRHCEHPEGAWQSLFCVPNASWTTEIATSGQNTPFLAMT